MIHITETAAKALTTTIKAVELEDEKEVAGIRLTLLQQGCTGFAYSFESIDTINETDHMFQSFDMIDEGYVLAVADDLLARVDGMTIDYELVNNICYTYRFINPNVDHECGCGKSVNFK